jgi:hypothetical protein
VFKKLRKCRTEGRIVYVDEMYTYIHIILLVSCPINGLYLPVSVVVRACSSTFVAWLYQYFKSH